MYLNRKIDSSLSEWKNDPHHKPLLMRGARQVGKTTAVRRLAESFQTFVEVNLEVDGEVRKFIENSFDVQGFITLIEIRYAKRIIPGETLLFLDEIQSCPKAVAFLRYLYEKIQPLESMRLSSKI